MCKLLSLETSSVPQPCLGHPLVPAWLRLQKCFTTNINYHSGFITAFPSSFCLCCLETMLKATSTRSITHLGTNNWDEGRWSREDLFAQGRFSAPWQEPETVVRTQAQRAEHQDGRPDTEQRGALLHSADISAPHQLVYSQLRRTYDPCSHGGIIGNSQNSRKKADKIFIIMN